MKNKIVEALKTKFKHLGLSEKVFDGVADILSQTITEEGNIETGISGVEPLLKSFQGEVDKYRTETAELKKKLDAKPSKKEKEVGEGEDKPIRLEDIQKMLDERDEERRKKEENASAFLTKKQEALSKLLKKEGVKESVVKKLVDRIEDGENVTPETIAEKVQSEYDALASEFSPEAGFPYRASGAEQGKAPSDIKDFCSRKKAEFKSAQENKELV